ncbi:SH3 domain-containing protein [Heyndrickxia sp. NPDC080065]|uniref:SH3 domain-containing protein n=1 Tax=Heyndrickxia sp. NPDC080065 TaxID=3390568 RepID=UPI003D08AA46
MKKGVIVPSLCFAVLSTVAFENTIHAAEPAKNEIKIVNVSQGSSLNMRSSASTKASIIMKLAKGTEVTILSESNGWSKIKAKGKTGYVSSQYLVKAKGTGTTPAKTVIKYVDVKAGSSLNMRSSASTSAAIVVKLTKGTEVTVLSESKGWSKIKAKGKTGYVSSQYLSKTKGKTTSSISQPQKETTPAKTVIKYVDVKAGSSLNMRSNASTSASVIAKLSKGTEVTVLSESKGWSKIKASGKTGYVSSQYLSKTKGKTTSSTSQPPKETTPAKTVIKYVDVQTGSSLNMRSSASASAAIVAKLSKGTEVTVLSESKGWSKIKASGKTGYVSSQYLAKTKGNTSTTPQPPKETTPAETVIKYVDVEAGSSLNMRSSASTSAAIVAKLTKGTEVTVLSESNGWSKIKANGKTGYVSSQFLSKSKQNTNTEPKTKYVNIESVSGISMYTKPSTDSSIIVNIAKGVPVLVYSESNGWSKIRVYGEDGYVKTEFLSETKPIDNSGENNGNSSEEDQSIIKYVNVDPGSNLNMRSTPSAQGSVITKLTRGTAVKVLSEENGWSKITANGKTGYVSSQYLILNMNGSDLNNGSKTYNYNQYNLSLDKMVQIQTAANAQTDNKYRTYIREDALTLDSLTKPTKGTVNGTGWNVRGGAGTSYWIVGQVSSGSSLKILSSIKGSDGYTWYEVDYNKTWVNASPEDIKYYLDPSNFINDSMKSLQFINLSKSTNLEVTEVNDRILSGKGILSGKAAAFITAGQQYNINEIYLISHALLETGNGTSTLAKGVKVNGKTVYNMYGIGAYDGDAITAGAQFAYNAGWFTPEQAIIGGAQFIAQGYINAGQNTLYKMRWNPDGAVKLGAATHQYATDIGWAEKQIIQIHNLYSLVSSYSLIYEVPVYK